MINATQVGDKYWELVRDLHNEPRMSIMADEVQNIGKPSEHKGMKYRVTVTVERVK